MRIRLVIMAAIASICAGFLHTAAAQEALPERARAAMQKAGEYWATKVASHGGYVWEYSTDFVTRRRGESGDLPLSTNWVQPPGRLRLAWPS